MLGSAFRLFNLNEVIDVQQLGILDDMNCIINLFINPIYHGFNSTTHL